jgi:two-component system, chemotaxis family, chemotaxis protein CheY
MKRFKVLAADDDAVARGLLTQVLEEDMDLELILVEDGEQAWKKLNEGFAPDFCVFDMMMPQLNGLDLLKRLRADKRFRSLPVVLCTAVGDDGTIETAASLDVMAYVMKPYQTESLGREIKELLVALS